jgi:hypothetical protein
MAADDNPLPNRPQAPRQGNPPKAPPGFASLARRISSWTSKGILTGIILVVGLVFGRQVLVWWGEGDPARNPPPPPAAPSEALGDETAEHVLRFGDNPWSMRRQVISGDVHAAVTTLLAKCRRDTLEGGVPEAPPGPQEQTLLRSLAGRQHVDREEGKWRTYQFNAAVPMVVGIRVRRRGVGSSGGKKVAGTDLRVVSWGFGVPADSNRWTLYTFVWASPTSGPAPGIPVIPLPPDCRRTLSMGVAEGGAVVGFRGPAQPDTWKVFFDQQFRTRGWRRDGPWRPQAGRWFNRYAQGPGPDGAAVDVQFGPDGPGQMTGLLMITPGKVQPRKGKRS